jgi:hypothetical protein
MALWEWKPSIDSSKPIIRRPGRRGSTAYGAVKTFDQVAPTRRVSFSGEGFSTAERAAIEAVHMTASDGADADLYELVDFVGDTWEGVILSFRAEPIDGTGLWAIEIAMEDPTYTPAV